MTQTQVRYWEYQESKRHNAATEKLGTDTLSETIRHDIATEKLTSTDLAEKRRHNKATEKLTASQIAENIRHNKVSEKYDAQRAKAALISADASQKQAKASLSQAATAARLANSTISLNKATENLRNAEITLTASKSAGEIARALKGTKIGDYAALIHTLGAIAGDPNIDSATKTTFKALIKDIENVVPSGSSTGKGSYDAGLTAESAAYVNDIKAFLTRLGLAANNWSWTINQ